MNNHNIVLAILEVKGIITHEEAAQVAEFLSSSVIPSQYTDAVTTVTAIFEEIADKK